ncbi:hypothetical protein [Acidipila sp. EB88]|uniref:hypothetical protein n=1 Tax=Acidipila sp. EB88 TaxID=2305226 RepID=UPI000F5FD827|nr:hypothetical protein [Acidipila sp. EB88]RRA47341.1 hypothetical protein D1Y84_02535 [Acidipila sp. EB88]
MTDRLISRRGAGLFALNALGAMFYVYAASFSWVMPQECAAGLRTITGEPITWAVAILPILSLFFLINFVWGVGIVRRRRWGAGRWWLAAAVLWPIAVWIDFAHHACPAGS